MSWSPRPAAPTELRELLRQQPFLRYARQSHGGQLVEQFLQQRRLCVHKRVELDEPCVLLQMVAAGLGCAIVPGALLGGLRQAVAAL